MVAFQRNSRKLEFWCLVKYNREGSHVPPQTPPSALAPLEGMMLSKMDHWSSQVWPF